MFAKSWKDLNRQDLAKLSSEASGSDIARIYGVTPGAVYYKLRVYGVVNARKRRFDPPKKELERMYQTMSFADIAKHYGVGETVVFMRCKQHGIGGINRSERLSGRPKSIEHRLAMSRSARESGVRSGERNGNWKGGKSSENKRGRSKAAYHEWKTAVMANANWRCQSCGKEQGSICECCGHRILLHAHHLVSFSDAPKQRYEASNGQALCERCHWFKHHE